MDDTLALVTKLRQDGERLDAYMQSLSEDSRKREVYTEGALWTVRSVLAHLMSAERAFVQLFREIQQGGDGVYEGFSIDRFNAREQSRNKELGWDETLSSFRETRARMLDLVTTFTATDLEKKGRHPFLGVTSLREMVKMIYIHDQTHMRDIRKAVGSG